MPYTLSAQLLPVHNGPARARPLAGARPGVQPWSKAGLIIKANTTQGSAYAAIMVTGGHGVRWQYAYTHDTGRHPLARSPQHPRAGCG